MFDLIRIDRLGIVILDSWFAYYEAKQPDFKDTGESQKIDMAFIDTCHRAHTLWANGLVRHQRGGEFRVLVPQPEES